MNNHNAHDLHKWAQQRAGSCVSCLDSWSSWLKSFTCLSSSRHVAHVWFSLIFTYLPFYFDLSFSVFFHSSVLCTLTCTPTSTTWTPWKITCATPPRRATTLTTSPSPSQLKSADPGTIETVFRTIMSLNQLSYYGTDEEMCEECEFCHDRTGTNCERTIQPLCPCQLWWRQTYFSLMILHWRRSIAKILRTIWKCITARQIEQILYWCRVPVYCQSRTVLHDERHWRILTIHRFSGLSWVHIAKRRKFIWIRKRDSKEHQDWLQRVVGIVNMELRSELRSWTKSIDDQRIQSDYKNRKKSTLGFMSAWWNRATRRTTPMTTWPPRPRASSTQRTWTETRELMHAWSHLRIVQ